MDAPAIAQLKILDNKTSSPSKAIESALPVGKAVTAKITQVTPEQARQDSHRVKLEINKSLLQISAKFSGSVPEKGSTVSLQRSASGQIQLSIIASGDSAAKQPSGNQASSSTTAANANASNNRTTAETTATTQSNANNPVKTTGSEQSTSANSAALTAKLAANNLSPLLANNTQSTSGQANSNSITLKVPVTINASGAALNIIEQALPKGETLSARVINQVLTNTSANNPTAASSNSQPTPLANSSGQIPDSSQQQNSGTAKSLTANQNSVLNNSATPAALVSAANKQMTSQVPTASSPAKASANPTVTNQPPVPAQAGPAKQTAIQAPTPAATTQPGTAPAASLSSPIAGVAGAKASANSPSAVASNNINPAAPATSSGKNSQLAPSTAPSTGPVSGPASAAVTTSTSNNVLHSAPLSTSANTTNSAALNNPSQQNPATTNTAAPLATHAASTRATNTTATNTSTTSSQSNPAAVSSQPLGAIPRHVIQSAPSSGAPLNSPTVNTTPVANSSTATAISTDKAAVSNLSASVTSPAPGAPTAVTPQNQQLNNLQAQTTAIKISVAGQQVSLQGPANLPPLQNVQITRVNGAQANIQWQQPSQPATLPVTPLLNSRQAQVVEQSLRQALPQQIPIAEGINQLVAQSVQIANSSSNINIPVDKIALSIMQLFGVKPGAHTSSATIKRNVQHGGLFTESKLLNQGAGNQADMKNFLSKLRQLAKQLPAEQKELLLNTTDRMLARVTASQLTHVQQQHTKGEITNERTFQIDIPVQQNEKLDNVEMEIKQRKHRNEQGEFISVWSVKLHFDLAEHGEVDAEVALNPTDNSISTTFFCSNLNTVHKIERAMPSFRKQLHQQGFEINTLHCTQGSQAAAAANNPINKRIIDIRT